MQHVILFPYIAESANIAKNGRYREIFLGKKFRRYCPLALGEKFTLSEIVFVKWFEVFFELKNNLAYCMLAPCL